MQDGDEWGVKTSEGKTGESYGRHGGRPSTGPGSSFGAGQGNDLLGEAEDFMDNGRDRPYTGSGEGMRDRMVERERERARQRAAGSFGGSGVSRSAKPNLGASPVKSRAVDFSRPRQNLSGPGDKFNAKPKGGFSGFTETSSFDPFESDDDELPTELSFDSRGRSGRRTEKKVAAPLDGHRTAFVEESFDDEDRWQQRQVPSSAKKKSSSSRPKFDSSEEDEPVRRRANEGKVSEQTPKRRTAKDFTDDDDGIQEVTTPSRKKKTPKAPRPPPSKTVDSDDENGGSREVSTPSKKKKPKKKKTKAKDSDAADAPWHSKGLGNKSKTPKKPAPRPPSDDEDDDDTYKIDPNARDRRGLTKEERLDRARQRAARERGDDALSDRAVAKSKTFEKSKAPGNEEEDYAALTAKAPKPDMDNLKGYLMSPLRRRDGIVQCYIERKKGGPFLKLYPEYHLYLTDGDTFLLAAKKRSQNTTSNYLISTDQNDMSRKSSNFIGKLRSNFLGTEFIVYDNGMNPSSGDSSSGTTRVREELGMALYASNVLGSRGPRKMRVCVPVVDERSNRRVVFQPQVESDGMLAKFKDKEMDQLFYMINKPPRWNDQVGSVRIHRSQAASSRGM